MPAATKYSLFPAFFHWHPICCKKGRICRNTFAIKRPYSAAYFCSDEFYGKITSTVGQHATMAATCGRRAFHLFGDVATELLIKADGDSCPFSAPMTTWSSSPPSNAGDYIEACVEKWLLFLWQHIRKWYLKHAK